MGSEMLERGEKDETSVPLCEKYKTPEKGKPSFDEKAISKRVSDIVLSQITIPKNFFAVRAIVLFEDNRIVRLRTNVFTQEMLGITRKHTIVQSYFILFDLDKDEIFNCNPAMG